MTISRLSQGPAARAGVLLAVLVLVTACGGSSGAAAPDAARFGSAGGDQALKAVGPENGSATGTQGGTTTTAVLDASRPDLLVIKTGTMDLQVGSIEKAIGAAGAKVAALDGYVSGSQQTGEGERATASVTYRIPADRWDEALAALRGLGIKVLDEKTETQDVTGQVVDLGARITNLQATERALQLIMDKATKISDVLDVQTELTKVRGDIEQATAEKQHLTEQAAFSTLTVGFGLRPEAAIVVSQQKFDPKSEVDRAAATMVDILQGLATAGIWFAIVWLPILVVLAVLGLVVAFLIRRRLPRGGGAPTDGQEPPAPSVDAPAPAAG